MPWNRKAEKRALRGGSSGQVGHAEAKTVWCMRGLLLSDNTTRLGQNAKTNMREYRGGTRTLDHTDHCIEDVHDHIPSA